MGAIDETNIPAYTCTHCGKQARGGAHIEGNYSGKQRCDPADSNLSYGYNAHPIGTQCERPCLGAVSEG